MDFSVIMERCGVDKDTPQNVITNIANLEEFYDDNELVEIYNYILTNVKNPEIEPLIDVVQDEDEKSVYVKESATFALGLLGDTSAIDPLVAIMESKQGLWDKFSFLKEKIIEALGKLNINSNKVLRVLKSSMLDPSPMVRINTIEALMNSEYDEAEELIRTALKDEDKEVQRNALVAMYNLIGRDILDEVISLPGYSKFLKEEAQNMIDEYENSEEENENE